MEEQSYTPGLLTPGATNSIPQLYKIRTLLAIVENLNTALLIVMPNISALHVSYLPVMQ